MDNLLFNVLLSFYILMGTLTLVLHLTGLYSLWKIKRRNNFHIILIHLSICVIIMQIFRFGAVIYVKIYKENISLLSSNHGSQVITTLAFAYNVCYILIMAVLALDPLLMVLLKTGYSKHVNKFRMKVVLAGCWVLCIICASASFAMPFVTRHTITTRYAFPILCAAFLVFSVGCYTVIYRTTRRQDINAGQKVSTITVDERKISTISVARRKIPKDGGNISTMSASRHKISMLSISSSSSSSSKRKSAMNFRVPMLIISTFFVFVALPVFVNVFVKYKITSITVTLIVTIFYSIGFLLDAIVYLLLHPSTKQQFKTFFVKKHKISNARILSSNL